MSAMKFCRECNNILYPKEEKERKLLLFACRNCEHRSGGDNCVYRNIVHHEAGEAQILQDVASTHFPQGRPRARCGTARRLLPGYSKRGGGDDSLLRVLQPLLRQPVEGV
ncbi:hypothetical protein CFC21_059701, partial [Triticum aestivum]